VAQGYVGQGADWLTFVSSPQNQTIGIDGKRQLQFPLQLQFQTFSIAVNIQTATLQLSTEMNVGLQAQFRYRTEVPAKLVILSKSVQLFSGRYKRTGRNDEINTCV